MKTAIEWILLALAGLQFVAVALPPGNADLVSVQSLALDLSKGDSSLLYPGKNFSRNDQWIQHHEHNLRLMNGSGEPNWCFYPPLIPFLLKPFAHASAEVWRIVWGVAQVVLTFVYARVIIRLLEFSGVVPHTVLVLALVLGSYPVARSLQLGQTSLLLAVLMWFGILANLHGNRWIPFLTIGFCVLVKPFLALLGVIDLAKRKLDGVIGVAAVLAGLLVVSILAVGLHAHAEYWNLLTTLGTSQTAYYGNQSLLAGVLRLISNLAVMDYGFQQQPVLGMLGNVMAIVLVVIALRAQWKAGEVSLLASAGLWISVALLALPISWEHHLLFLLPALAYLWSRSWTRGGWIALGAATLLLQVSWFSFYGDEFGGRLAATLPVFGNLILYMILVNVHLKSQPRVVPVILEEADVRS